ncbi:polyglutamine-binding protein 1-like [Watersipora subatra]|uniref:polyglutamine-binding protein 1-like n=1 Tax=Watersipora subatra TaxID=2589382 RepID=UPI00355BC4D3
MPLPAALLAKLKNRGIVHQDGGDQVEEVFAESYDEKDQPEQMETQPEIPKEDFSVKVVYEMADCPNTTNPYHECEKYCMEYFGIKTFEHKHGDERKRIRMLKKYPLPTGWTEVGDPQSGRCYYWNPETDKVSWLPPQHPRAKITVSVEKLKSRLAGVTNVGSGEGGLASMERRKPVSVSIKEPKRRTTRRETREELDPMDPASYSEVERGSWSTGLKADTKTGVDTTASGPLFQQRPYPSPGDILRAQAAAQQD